MPKNHRNLSFWVRFDVSHGKKNKNKYQSLDLQAHLISDAESNDPLDTSTHETQTLYVTVLFSMLSIKWLVNNDFTVIKKLKIQFRRYSSVALIWCSCIVFFLRPLPFNIFGFQNQSKQSTCSSIWWIKPAMAVKYIQTLHTTVHEKLLVLRHCRFKWLQICVRADQPCLSCKRNLNFRSSLSYTPCHFQLF